MFFMLLVPSKELENRLQKLSDEINKAKGYNLITIERGVTRKDINIFDNSSPNSNEIIFQSPFPVLKIKPNSNEDLTEVRNIIDNIYKEFNKDISKSMVVSFEEFFKLKEEAPKEESQPYQQKPWFQMPQMFPKPIPNPFNYLNPFANSNYQENNTMNFSTTNYPNFFSFTTTQTEESKKLETQLDLISLSMDQIDNLMNNLETYHKSGKLTDEIKNHLKTAMKQRLTELNNLIENL